MRTALLVITLVVAASAEAQQVGGAYPTRQTALTALGRTGQLTGGYRGAARPGVGVPGGSVAPNKPFSHVSRGPTVSPYLNLFREEAANAAPNYHVFVQPQLQQQQLIQAQQQQLLQLQGRLRQAPAPRVAGGARYGDTSHYFSGWRR